MDLTHIHLLLNHFPAIGMIIGGGLFIVALMMKSDDLKLASLVVLLGIALLAIPTYMSGNGAEEGIKPLPGVSRSLMHAHEGAAFVTIAFMEVLGAFAWLGLWQFRRLMYIPNWSLTVVLLLTLVTFGLMTLASNIEGQIRHAEIRAALDPAAGTGTGTENKQPPGGLARTVGSFVTETPWMWPTCETLHFVGLSLLLGVVLLVDIRMKGLSFASLHRLLPWAALGFGVNFATGLLFFRGNSGPVHQQSGQHKPEPNSGLGKAISYLLRHLDNNALSRMA